MCSGATDTAVQAVVQTAQQDEMRGGLRMSGVGGGGGDWDRLAMHKHQYRPGYSGRARNRDRGDAVRCAVGGVTSRWCRRQHSAVS